MRIGDVADRARVGVKTVRYWEQIGILEPPEREPNGYRDFSDDVIDRIAFVRAAQAVGLTLGEIREVIRFRERGEPPCSHVLELIERHAAELTERIAELERMRTDLRALVRRGRRLDPRACAPTSICHIIPQPRAG